MNKDLSEKVVRALERAKDHKLDSDYVDLLIYMIRNEERKEANDSSEQSLVNIHQMTVAELSPAVYKSSYTIKRLINSGKLKATKVKHKFVLDFDDLPKEFQEMVKRYYC